MHDVVVACMQSHIWFSQFIEIQAHDSFLSRLKPKREEEQKRGREREECVTISLSIYMEATL